MVRDGCEKWEAEHDKRGYHSGNLHMARGKKEGKRVTRLKTPMAKRGKDATENMSLKGIAKI
jgi:hypothetical protein